jgi:ABC-type transport system involved in Fe-S cluster assembly fused permease/ATPase subunit
MRSFNQQRMIECATLAPIHDEIMAMPMTYKSLIGDMGSSLSGGQKQRTIGTGAVSTAANVFSGRGNGSPRRRKREMHQREP